MAIPINQLPIGEGRDPAGNPGASFFIDRDALELIERDGPEWKFDDARFIEEGVNQPDAIFEEQGSAGQRASLCYSVRPTQDPDEESESFPRYGYVFVVFVCLGVGGYVVFDWEWREEDPETPGHPLNWETDFARRSWQRT